MPFQSSRRRPERNRPGSAEGEEPEGEPQYRDGTVTRVVRQKRDPERASVFIDDRFAFGLAIDVVVEAALRKGLVLSAERQRELVAREHQRKARAAALDYLSHQARSTEEVRRKLKGKGFDETATEDAVQYVAGHGYLDDAAYAVAYVKSRFSGRGYGPQRLRQELQQRGVPRDAVEAAIAALDEGEEVDDAALGHARTRWRSLAAEEDPRKRRKKTMDYLVRRGFDFEQARQAVERAAAEAGVGDDEVAWE